jgi:hypothetical protein
MSNNNYFFPLLELGMLNLQTAFTNNVMKRATTIKRRRLELSPTTTTLSVLLFQPT